MTAPTLAFIGGLGVGEILVIGVIALLLFGRRLPEVARSVGKGVSEFKRGLSGVQDDVRSHMTADPLPAPPTALPGPAPAPVDAQPELPAAEDAEASPAAPPQSPSESPSSAAPA